MRLTTRRAAVLGKPVTHSLSPAIHNAGYAAAGLAGWSYTAIECAEPGLADLVGSLAPQWAGLSLTMPLKQVALAVADGVAPLAATLGAANTLVRRSDGGWYAENTDAPGMVEALGAGPASGATRATPTAAGPGAGTGAGHMVVLGAGGTARAALAAAARLGARRVTVVARRQPAAAAFGPVAEALAVALSYRPWADAAEALAAADLVVSTVPKGVADPLAGQVSWRAGTVVLDALYDPWPTPLAGAATAAGCRVVSGRELLLAQAVGQFQLFTGVPAPIEAMRTALFAAAGVT